MAVRPGQEESRTVRNPPPWRPSHDLFILIQKLTPLVPTAWPTAETLPPAFPLRLRGFV